MKKALITGITGQDGSYLAEFLIAKGYQVHGIIRRSSSFNTGRIRGIFEEIQKKDARLILHYGDLTDGSSIARLIRTIVPDEIYNLAAQSHVRTSFDIPEYTANVTAMGNLRLLECIRETGIDIKFYQAGSSEMFGNAPAPQSIHSPFLPVSPYAVSKLFAHQNTINYREGYNIFAVNGILFNHESPRRGETFVTRKITTKLAKVLKGEIKKIFLGNLDAKRDWGFAPEYVEAMWLMLQQKEPMDHVIATGEAHSVKEFLEEAFDLVGLDWQKIIEIDPRYFRPNEVHHLLGDASVAREKLGWKPKTSFKELVRTMVVADLINEGLDPREVIRK